MEIESCIYTYCNNDCTTTGQHWVCSYWDIPTCVVRYANVGSSFILIVLMPQEKGVQLPHYFVQYCGFKATVLTCKQDSLGYTHWRPHLWHELLN